MNDMNNKKYNIKSSSFVDQIVQLHNQAFIVNTLIGYIIIRIFIIFKQCDHVGHLASLGFSGVKSKTPDFEFDIPKSEISNYRIIYELDKYPKRNIEKYYNIYKEIKINFEKNKTEIAKKLILKAKKNYSINCSINIFKIKKNDNKLMIKYKTKMNLLGLAKKENFKESNWISKLYEHNIDLINLLIISPSHVFFKNAILEEIISKFFGIYENLLNNMIILEKELNINLLNFKLGFLKNNLENYQMSDYKSFIEYSTILFYNQISIEDYKFWIKIIKFITHSYQKILMKNHFEMNCRLLIDFRKQYEEKYGFNEKPKFLNQIKVCYSLLNRGPLHIISDEDCEKWHQESIAFLGPNRSIKLLHTYVNIQQTINSDYKRCDSLNIISILILIIVSPFLSYSDSGELLENNISFVKEIKINNDKLKIDDEVKYFSEIINDYSYGKILKLKIEKDNYNIKIILKIYKTKINKYLLFEKISDTDEEEINYIQFISKIKYITFKNVKMISRFTITNSN
jgi:hypothetical protein